MTDKAPLWRHDPSYDPLQDLRDCEVKITELVEHQRGLQQWCNHLQQEVNAAHERLDNQDQMITWLLEKIKELAK